MVYFKVAYKILASFEGVVKEYNFPQEKRAEAVDTFKRMRGWESCDRIRLFRISGGSEETWHNIGANC